MAGGEGGVRREQRFTHGILYASLFAGPYQESRRPVLPTKPLWIYWAWQATAEDSKMVERSHGVGISDAQQAPWPMHGMGGMGMQHAWVNDIQMTCVIARVTNGPIAKSLSRSIAMHHGDIICRPTPGNYDAGNNWVVI